MRDLTGVIVISSSGDRLMIRACLNTCSSLLCDNNKNHQSRQEYYHIHAIINSPILSHTSCCLKITSHFLVSVTSDEPHEWTGLLLFLLALSTLDWFSLTFSNSNIHIQPSRFKYRRCSGSEHVRKRATLTD